MNYYMEEYVNMCKKAVEIQKLVPKENELCLFSDGKKLYWRVINTEMKVGDDIEVRFLPVSLQEPSKKSLEKYIWLPTQEQLQKILFQNEFKLQIFHYCDIIYDFCDFMMLNRFNYALSIPEHFWLAFVMKKLFNKVWNGKKEKSYCLTLTTNENA